MTDDVKDKSAHGTRYWHEIEDAAFIAWFRHGRSFSKVVDLLTNDDEYRALALLEEGDPVPQAQTVRKWARDNLWEIKAEQKMRELAPYAIRFAAAEIAAGAKDAAQSMMRIARGENVTREDRTVMDAAKFVLQSSIGDSIAQMAKATIQESIDMSQIETMEDAIEAERKIKELESQNG